MSEHHQDETTRAITPDEVEEGRALLDQLLTDSKLYKSSQDYLDLLDFVTRLPDFAPFNAMLLQVQKPGLTFAASARDWRERFGCTPKEAARPLLILWPFGPVGLVYDVLDVEGGQLPDDVSSFLARGAVDSSMVDRFYALLERRQILVTLVDAGDGNAGLIRVASRPKPPAESTTYRLHINRNHAAATQFTTLAHELGHLCLGHLGPDPKLKIPERARLDHPQMEIEAESVAYIVCGRNGVTSKSHPYLSSFVKNNTTSDDVDIYQVMRAAGQVEMLLGLARRSGFDAPKRRHGRDD